MEHSIRILEMYGAYSHIVHQENVRICEPKAMHSSILATCDSILASYVFRSIPMNL